MMLPKISYKSTRGGVTGLTFRECVLSGLADDGGLFVPDRFPDLSAEMPRLLEKSFEEIAFTIMKPFVGDSIPEEDLKSLIERSYSTFRHDERTPVIAKGDVHILELFHGPSFAFKDVALQMVGNLFEYFIKDSRQQVTVLGATSGDTGSAAIYGLRGKAGVECFILYPHGRVSAVQELQMTTVLDKNVHNVAIEGDFDTAQDIVKACFNDLPFKKKHNLAAVNSINFARILAQITYYVYAWSRLQGGGEQKKVSFAVPTGNFGDILAGYYAKLLGLPVENLVVATNENDILHRFFESGRYEKKGITQTIAPSMDIQISSNFERFLYAMCGNDSNVLKGWMDGFSKTGMLEVPAEVHRRAKDEMTSGRCDRSETLGVMKDFHTETGYVLDPHTAIGVKVGRKVMKDGEIMVCLATAHPGKFGDAVKMAVGDAFVLPPELSCLAEKEFRREVMDGTVSVIKAYMEATLKC